MENKFLFWFVTKLDIPQPEKITFGSKERFELEFGYD